MLHGTFKTLPSVYFKASFFVLKYQYFVYMVKSIQYYPLLFVDIPGAGIAINSMCVNEAFCVTGSDDGFLRLWPLDFKHVYLEAGRFRDVDVNLELCV